jgi:hypothetical protein
MSVSEWQQDALAVGFHPDAIAVVTEFVAGGVVDVDGPPIEAFPGYWVIPGFLRYDGLVILAALDCRLGGPGGRPGRCPGAAALPEVRRSLCQA